MSNPDRGYEHFQRETAAKWCLGRLMAGGCPCERLCAGCTRNANRAINASWCRDNPDAIFAQPGKPGAWHPVNIVVFRPDQRAEYNAELARRKTRLDLMRAQNDGRDVDAGLVAALAVAR